MKLNVYLLLFLLTILQACNSQTTPKKEIHNKDFNWTITIPEDFESISAADWEKLQKKGEKAMEDTFEQDIVNQAKTIFVFRNGQSNLLESNYQPFDPSIDGNYLESWKNVNEMVYQTFKAQLPDAKITRKNSIEKIDKLDFNVHTMEIEMPNKMILTSLMFSRLFGKREFTVNIMFIESAKGKLMLDAWRNSKFGK